MDNQELINELLRFKDKAFCYYTHEHASSIWRRIEKLIPEPYRTKIAIEWSHIRCGHGHKTACDALNDEIQKYINIKIKKQLSELK